MDVGLSSVFTAVNRLRSRVYSGAVEGSLAGAWKKRGKKMGGEVAGWRVAGWRGVRWEVAGGTVRPGLKPQG